MGGETRARDWRGPGRTPVVKTPLHEAEVADGPGSDPGHEAPDPFSVLAAITADRIRSRFMTKSHQIFALAGLLAEFGATDQSMARLKQLPVAVGDRRAPAAFNLQATRNLTPNWQYGGVGAKPIDEAAPVASS